MLRGTGRVVRKFQPFPQQFRFISIIDHKKSLLEELKLANETKPKVVYEVKPIAEVVNNSAKIFKNLISDWEWMLKNNPTQTNNKHIIASIPMPLSLIKRVYEENIQSVIDSNQIKTFKFIIRKYYPGIYNKCSLRKNGIIGTPGIAKSVSLLYPLLDHIANKPADIPVLLDSREEASIFFDGNYWKIDDPIKSDSLRDLRNCLRHYPGLLYLVDGPTGQDSHLHIDGENSKTILASSPGKHNYHEFLKDGAKYMMPGWSLEELLEAREDINPNISEETVRERYWNVGGIVRGIFSSENAAKEYFEDLRTAVISEFTTTNKMILKVDVENGLETKDIGAVDPFSHKVYHFVVDPEEFKTQKVIFASEWVKLNLDPSRLKKLEYDYLEEKRKNPNGSEEGAIYERYVYSSWCAAPTTMENLVSKETKDKRKFWRNEDAYRAPYISTPESFCEYVEKLFKEPLEKDGHVTIIKPNSETFPAVDFAVYDHSEKRLRLVQVTRNENKKLSADSLMLFSGLSKVEGLEIRFLLVTDSEKLVENAKRMWEKSLGEKREEIEKWLTFDAFLYGKENRVDPDFDQG